MTRSIVLAISFIIQFILFLFLASVVLAVEIPSFPLCSNPQGNLKVKYDEGVHGVPGDVNEYRGSDSVYEVTDTTLIQCLCTEEGVGIQTDWWKVSDLEREEIERLRDERWVYVADGSVWGLDASEYLAKNVSYSCGGAGSNMTPTPTSTPSTPTSSSNNSDANTGGVVIAAATLAPTGNILLIYSLFSFGLSSLLLGLMLRKKVDNLS